MADFDQNLHTFRTGNQGGSTSGGATGGDNIANEKESPEIIVEGAKKFLTATLPKALSAIPFIGSFLSKLIPINPGEVSAVASFETQGITGKPINPGKGGLPGGTLYNAIAAPFIKNSAITNHAHDVGGGASIESSSTGGVDFAALVGAPGSYGDHDWTPVSRAELGTFPPPSVGDAGTGPAISLPG